MYIYILVGVSLLCVCMCIHADVCVYACVCVCVYEPLCPLCVSISEEDIEGPLRTDFDGKSGTKVSRTFSYLKNKIYKKTRVSTTTLLHYY